MSLATKPTRQCATLTAILEWYNSKGGNVFHSCPTSTHCCSVKCGSCRSRARAACALSLSRGDSSAATSYCAAPSVSHSTAEHGEVILKLFLRDQHVVPRQIWNQLNNQKMPTGRHALLVWTTQLIYRALRVMVQG